MPQVGFGNAHSKVAVVVENRPPMSAFDSLSTVFPLELIHLTQIVDQCGNHWRKIINCYAKLMFQLTDRTIGSWQEYRDTQLLRADSDECLLFSPTSFDEALKHHRVVIVTGKIFAQTMPFYGEMNWLSSTFAQHPSKPILIAPYFDYRQLSNQKLDFLVQLLRSTMNELDHYHE